MADILSYTTVDDVKKESGMQDNENIGDEDVQDFINTATAIINGYLSGKYEVPFALQPETPQLIERICRGIASAYLLMQEYGPMSPGDAKDGDAKEKLMMKLLEKVQKGTMVVVDNDGKSILANDKTSTSSFPSGDSNVNSTIHEDTGGFGVAGSDEESTNGPYIQIGKKW